MMIQLLIVIKSTLWKVVMTVTCLLREIRCLSFICKPADTKQLLDEVEHDIMN